MSQTTAELQLTQPTGPYKIAHVPNTPPSPTQIRLRLHAIALNLLDKKQRDTGLMITQYPIVLGLEGAGTITEIGPEVSGFAIGDEVIACPAGKAKGLDWGGAYAEYTNVPADFFVAKKPAGLSFEEAASLPIAFLTAVTVLANSFGIPLPFLPELQNAGPLPASVLVLGGSSATGAAAIQLLRLAHPALPIYATSSSHNFDKVLGLGATAVFDYHSATLITDVKAATPGEQGVDMIFDFVAAGAKDVGVCDVLDPKGLKRYGAVVTGAEIKVPEGVSLSVNDGWEITTMQGGKSVLPTLTKLVEEGKYRLPVPVKVEGQGLEQIPLAVENLHKVSGMKIVVTV